MIETNFNFLALLATHFLADFVLQTHWQAQNKSKNNVALSQHVMNYTLVLAIAAALLFGVSLAWSFFVLLNAALHGATDYCTSRLAARQWHKQHMHNFFVVIGFDQLMHQVTLGLTMLMFFGNGGPG